MRKVNLIVALHTLLPRKWKTMLVRWTVKPQTSATVRTWDKHRLSIVTFYLEYYARLWRWNFSPSLVFIPTVSDTFRFHWENVCAMLLLMESTVHYRESRWFCLCSRGELLWWRVGFGFVRWITRVTFKLVGNAVWIMFNSDKELKNLKLLNVAVFCYNRVKCI